MEIHSLQVVVEELMERRVTQERYVETAELSGYRHRPGS